eukprot:10821610-Heterocapsa_arctica.AAC.1
MRSHRGVTPRSSAAPRSPSRYAILLLVAQDVVVLHLYMLPRGWSNVRHRYSSAAPSPGSC